MRHADIIGKEIFDRIRKRSAFRAIIVFYRIHQGAERHKIVVVVLHYADFGKIAVFNLASVSQPGNT